MSKRTSAFRQSDLARALRAAKNVAPGAHEIIIGRDGTIKIVLAPTRSPPVPVAPEKDWRL